MWQRLASNLATIIKYYQALAELNEEKRKVLTFVDMQGLEKVVHHEEKIIADINKAEELRQQIVRELAAADVKIQPDMKLVQMSYQCPDNALRERLLRLHAMLDELVKKVKQTSENNEILIVAALNAVNFRLNKLGGVTVENRYGSHGQEQVSHARNLDFEA